MRRACLFVAGVGVAVAACDYPPNGPWPASAEPPSAAPSVSPIEESDGGGGGVDATAAALPSSEDGGAGFAPADDAAAPSATASDPEAGAGCASAVVCEDFEELPIGALDLPDAGGLWQVETPDCSGSGAVAIDGSQSHGGTRSLKVTGAAGYCNHVFLGTNAVAALSGGVDGGQAASTAIWARFYVQLSTALDADHAAFLAMRDTSTNTDLRLGGQSSILMWNRESDDATLPALSPAGIALSVAPSASAWHCIELEVDSSGPTLQTWVDGALIVGLVVGGSAAAASADGQWITNTSWAPRLVDARFGWESYANEAETLWFDDIAIGASRIGCGG